MTLEPGDCILSGTPVYLVPVEDVYIKVWFFMFRAGIWFMLRLKIWDPLQRLFWIRIQNNFINFQFRLYFAFD